MRRHISDYANLQKQILSRTINFIVGIVITLVLIVSATLALAAVENLDEVMGRKSRIATATWDYTIFENASNSFTWQPETLSYSDVLTGNEVWRLTHTPNGRNTTWDISKSQWSANGNRLLFASRRSTAAFNTYGANDLWMLSNTDGSRLRPAKGAASQLISWDIGTGHSWSPILADVFYSGGSASSDGQSNPGNNYYKMSVTDTSIAKSILVTLPTSATRIAQKKSISADGTKALLQNSGLWYIATIYPPASVGVDNPNGYNNLLNYDWYWGAPPTIWVGNHDRQVVGAQNGADGIWNYIMPENTGGSWWRARLIGSGADGTLNHTIDHTPPYNWGGELEPINGVGLDATGAQKKDAWCPQGTVTDTDCLDYFGHVAFDRWGRYSVSSDSGSTYYGVSIADMRLHKYKVTAFPTVYSPNHNDWDAWSDWSASSGNLTNSNLYATQKIATQKFTDINSQKTLASAHTLLNSNGVYNGIYESLARPTQSPDGTKVMFNSTFIIASDSYPQLFWTVAYYPYPPEIKNAAKNGSNVRLTWDFNQGTSCSTTATTSPGTGPTPNLSTPRTYSTRGWPHETLDCPPSPREIDKFRVWVSTDSTKWTPTGTTTYNNCRGNNECGMWTETAWTYDAAQSVSSTRYYALTSLEQSGLESHTLSNVWKVTLDANGNISQQLQQSGYPASPGGKTSFYTTPPPSIVVQFNYKEAPATAAGQYVVKWNAPANASMIRYYNIYAKDGSSPFTNATPLVDRQKSRIASIPASSDYSGTGAFSYIDWLGAIDGSTKYIVTAVDYQGNETQFIATPAAVKNVIRVSP